MTLFQILETTGLPVSYAFHIDVDSPIEPPYLVYLGNGQDTFDADNTHYYRQNRYQIEYYFTQKNEENESAIEDALLDAGYLYDKSEDVYIEEENVFVIYYNI
mgnify:CR=1 FL=1